MIADGIYLNLPAQIYRDDPALGGHDQKDILTNAVQWYAKARNAEWRALHPPGDDETAAKRFGTTLHAAVLEPDRFDSAYFVAPDMPDDWCETKDQMRAAMEEMGAEWLPKSATMDKWRARCRDLGISTAADWPTRLALIANGREPIPADWHRSMKLIQRVIAGHSRAAAYLSGGYAEVSIFWTDEHGTRLKARFDYLKTRPLVDVKTYAFRPDGEAIQNFVSQIESLGYDFLAAHYMDARVNALPALVEAERVYQWTSDADPWETPVSPATFDFFRRCARQSKPVFVFVACLTKGWPEVDTVEFRSDLMQFQTAAYQVDMARQRYREFATKFGDGEGATPWMDDRGRVVLTDYNFNSRRAQDRGTVKWEHGE